MINALMNTNSLSELVQMLEKTSLDDLLFFDCLAYAEKILDTKYGLGLDALALSLSVEISKTKKALLENMGDTQLSNKTEDYLKIITTIGFKEIQRFIFTSTNFDSESVFELFFIFYHEDGIILSFDTYGEWINSGHLYYNWKPNTDCDWHSFSRGSGAFKNGVFVGYCDCREALIRNINTLKKQGTFVKPWIATPFMWLVGYGEHGRGENYDYNKVKELTKQRLKICPTWAQVEGE